MLLTLNVQFELKHYIYIKHTTIYPDWCPFLHHSFSSLSYGFSFFPFSQPLVHVEVPFAETWTSWGRCDLWSYYYISVHLIIFYHCLRGLFELALYRSFSNLTSPLSAAPSSSRPPRRTLPRASRALLPTLRWTDGRCCYRQYLFISAYCFTFA